MAQGSLGERLTAAQAFGHFCAGLEYDALPTAVVERAKHFFIDYMAIALHASTLDSSRPVRALAAARPIPGGATLFGRADPVHASWAALANGMAAHSMELDDTFLPGSIHNEFFVFSPALALAEERGASGKRFLEAVVAGFEVACRVAAALQPAVTNRRGFHPTGTTGALGAAAAAGTLLGLDAAQMTVALGVRKQPSRRPARIRHRWGLDEALPRRLGFARRHHRGGDGAARYDSPGNLH